MKKRILCVILSLAAVFSLFGFNATEAWFSQGKNKSMVLNSGKLVFEADNLSTSVSGEYLPGDVVKLSNSSEGIKIKNNSSIETELRIKIDCEYAVKDDNGEPVTGEDGKNVIEKKQWVNFSFSEGTNNWKIVTGEDGITYLYYCPKGDASSAAPDYRIPAMTTEQVINFNNDLIISGEVSNDMIDKELTFKIYIQAKQADFVEWSEFKPDTETETPENQV